MSFLRIVQRVSVVLLTLASMTFPALTSHADTVDSDEIYLVFPQEASVTSFSSTFGARRSGGRRHHGNDLMAPKLTEVYAAADGTVRVVGTSSKAGRYVEIDHGSGWSTRYIHLNNDHFGTDDGRAPWSLTVAPEVVEGMRVHAGQLIGWVGDSGNAEWTGPHTHFELAKNGRAINPYPQLVGAYLRAEHPYIEFLADLDFELVSDSTD